ncbi:PilZ domain-containing protein [Hyalangium rubrum]|uniref:PilZ domain-containing protein n=1 Tax=Hyalangium rubrum TaxID=3103134 RepID=A0ABU5GUS5_9BACT|nr:PilZ domain-containing protein [Hyalangium sp. s54d21]MDY7224776.1 PilZ domain-containing protein [Hyalangium sp. s54d21]
MSEHERRRHRRYPLRLAIKVHRGSDELSADIINASVSGCLLLMAAPLDAGELLEVSIPEMMLPRARLKVLRSEPTPTGFMVATCFDAMMADEPSISQLSEK